MISNKVTLSGEFKKQATRSISAIFLFVIVYLVLFTLALGLTAACIYAGIQLTINFPRLITILLGIGIASLGLIVIFFLFKFIFASHKMDRSHLVEIKRDQEPRLFQLIDELVKEVGTKFPKKVYLTAEVNASVFYDSSFWSMFLPVQKNLVIGVGLVNGITELELRAILAHEFGHFSQRSMKVGSYVYNVNQVIYNMLYQNESLDDVINRWSSISGYFGIFMLIAVKIIQGIQWILKKVYNVVNLSYMGLSREMEFHADEIAAHVAGPTPLKDSLLRMNLLDYAYARVLGHYSDRIKDNKVSANIYAEQAFLVDFLAKESELPYKNELPEISLEEINKFNKSKLVIKDQWASHPSTEDRILKLFSHGIEDKVSDGRLSNTLFSDIDRIQREFTQRLFALVEFSEEPMVKTLEEFKQQYISDSESGSFGEVYNGYYDNKNPVNFDLEEAIQMSNGLEVNDLFSQEMVDTIYLSNSLDSDIDVISQIVSKEFKIKSFDYDGEKFRQKDAKRLLDELKLEQQQLHEKIKANDMAVFNFFHHKGLHTDNDSPLKRIYQEYFDFDKENEERLAVYGRLIEGTQFINVPSSFDAIRNGFNSLMKVERDFKKHLEIFLTDENYSSHLTADAKLSFELYMKGTWTYFRSERYVDDNLHMLFTAINHFAEFLGQLYFIKKKNLLQYQEAML